MTTTPPSEPATQPADSWATTTARYFRTNLRIASKDGGIVPLEPNYTQRVFLNAVSKLRAAGLPPRIIALKSRQVGISTVSCGVQYMDSHENPNRSGLVIAHNEKSTRTLFRMMRRFVQNMPGEKPKRKFDNTKELHFEHNDSRLQVETVGEVRGYTAQDVHLSEMAFYKELAKETLTAVMQTVPRTLESLVVIESTANGVGNLFHEMWERSIKDWNDPKVPLPERGFYPIFVPWHKHEEYRMKPWFLPGQMSASEHMLCKQFNLTPDQIAWRRWCVKNNCDGSEETFNQEYPATWKEAFLLTGRPIFDKEPLLWIDGQALDKDVMPESSEIEWDEEPDQPQSARRKVKIIPVPRGRLTIYEEPKKRHRYIIGADPSEGDAGSDYSPLAVLDQMTLNHVATWHGRTPPEQLADIAMRLGYYYAPVEPALIINEANNHGISFHNEVIRQGYPALYYRKTSESSVAGAITMKPGFFNSTENKHFLFNTLRRWLHDKYAEHRENAGRFVTRCPILIGELLSLIYIRPEAGGMTKIEAQPGRYKDLATAFALCLIAHRGTREQPLEPYPEEEIAERAEAYYRARERDPERAREEIALLNMTADEIFDELDRMDQDAARRAMLGTGGMQ